VTTRHDEWLPKIGDARLHGSSAESIGASVRAPNPRLFFERKRLLGTRTIAQFSSRIPAPIDDAVRLRCGVHAMPTTKRTQQRQLTIFSRGGARRGAGRKPKGACALVAHAQRPRVTPHDPVLVTTHLVAGLPSLRRASTLLALRTALAAGSARFGFRLVEYSIQSNHLHLVVEAEDARAISRGMQGLLVRIATTLHRAWECTGTVFRDRYHARVLRSPREVRAVLVYVLQNARKHGARFTGVDSFSSGAWFRGWRDRVARLGRPIAEARSWLLTTGWTRGGLLSTHEEPAWKPESGP